MFTTTTDGTTALVIQTEEAWVDRLAAQYKLDLAKLDTGVLAETFRWELNQQARAIVRLQETKVALLKSLEREVMIGLTRVARMQKLHDHDELVTEIQTRFSSLTPLVLVVRQAYPDAAA